MVILVQNYSWGLHEAGGVYTPWIKIQNVTDLQDYYRKVKVLPVLNIYNAQSALAKT